MNNANQHNEQMRGDEITDEVSSMTEGQLNEGLISDEINEIISNEPNWIINYGVSLIGLLSIILIALSWYIRYPEMLSTSMIIRKSNNKFYGEIVVNGEGFKKVAVGQAVMVRPENYLNLQSGYLQGEISSLGLREGNIFFVDVTFSSDMQANYKKLFQLEDDVKVNADVVIERSRLIKKIFPGFF